MEFKEPERPHPTDLAAFLPYACTQLQAPFCVRVHCLDYDDFVGTTPDDTRGKKLKSVKSATQTSRESSTKNASVSSGGLSEDAREVLRVTLALQAGRAVGLRLGAAPRPLLGVLRLCAPLQAGLARLLVRHAPLAAPALHDLAALLAASHLTELCLDDSPALHDDFEVLLERPTRLRVLSLARCGVGDAACARLAARLSYPRPAAAALVALTLASNFVTDAGAAALAAALRTNRALVHLDLAGNRITDAGFADLLSSLVEFPLTAEETTAKRRRLFAYSKARSELARKFGEELAATEEARAAEESARSRRRGGGAGSARRSSLRAPDATPDALAARALRLAEAQLGPHADPFATETGPTRDGRTWSPGNSTLASLDVSFNTLSWLSAARLETALGAMARRRDASAAAGAGRGLQRVVVDGNPLPVACAELAASRVLLEQACSWGKPRHSRPIPKSKK